MNLTPINYLLEIILETYFLKSRCLIIITDTNIEIKFATPFIYLRVNKTLNPQLIFHHYGCQDIIIHHDNAFDLFVQFEKWIRLKNERYNVRRFVISGKKSLEIFNRKELQYVADILVIAQNLETQKYDLLTHTYKNRTRELGTVLLDCWFPQNNSFQYGNDLFPDKLRDQNGRILRIGTFTYKPFSIVVDNETVHGTESSAILEFIQKHNLTPMYIVITDEDEWGNIYPNGSGTGVLSRTSNDEIDVGYGGIYGWEKYHHYLDYTKSVIRSGITLIVPAPELDSGLITPLRSFSNKMWIGVLLLFLADTIVLTYLFYKNHNRYYFQDSVITTIKLHLVQTLRIHTRSKTLKYFLALNMLNMLLLSSSYSSGLSSVMMIPRYKKAIKTVQDLASSGLHWGAPSTAWITSLLNVQEETYKTIKNNFVLKTAEELEAASKSRKMGFCLERLPYGHYAVGPYIKRNSISSYQIMQEDIYWQQCVFVVRKNSVLLPLLDHLLLRVFEAGLGDYWESEAVAEYMDISVQKEIRYHAQESTIVKLEWVHVEGAFGVLLLGYIVAILTFLIEIIKCKTMLY